MMKKFILFALFSFLPLSLFAQNLHESRILKISERKRSIYMDDGIFHFKTQNKNKQSLDNIRNSFDSGRGYERLVFDLSGTKPPRIYGMINKQENKIYVDLFNVSVGSKLKALKNTRFVKSVDFFSLDKESLSVEVNFKTSVTFDIFVLSQPARLVIDVKK